MKRNNTNWKETGNDLQIKNPTLDSKYLLPKLKSYSQNDVTSSSNLNLKTSVNSHFPFTHERNSVIDINTNKTELSKLSLIKYQYVSKSPAYFRRQQRSINSVRLVQNSDHQPVQSYVQSKIKQFNKQALLDLVNSRIKSVSSSNNKLNTIQQQTTTENPTINSRLNKTKINYQKLKSNMSVQKFSYIIPSTQFDPKTVSSSEEYGEKSSLRTGKNSRNTLIQKPLAEIRQQVQKNQQKYGRKFKTLEHQNVEFYETKYSNFQPNKIENVKSHIQNSKKYPSLKLNLYNFQSKGLA